MGFEIHGPDQALSNLQNAIQIPSSSAKQEDCTPPGAVLAANAIEHVGSWELGLKLNTGSAHNGYVRETEGASPSVVRENPGGV